MNDFIVVLDIGGKFDRDASIGVVLKNRNEIKPKRLPGGSALLDFITISITITVNSSSIEVLNADLLSQIVDLLVHLVGYI